MREVGGWDEAVDLIDEDDIKRWNADKKMDPKKFKSALAMTVTSDTMKNHLFCDNVWLKGFAETLQDKAAKHRLQETIQADNPGDSHAAKVDRPREDFNMPLSFWCNLGSVFFKGQKKHTAEAILLALPKNPSAAILAEYGHEHLTYDTLRSYKGESGN